MRHYLGRAYATLASSALGITVYDTQCGAKVFRVNDALGAALAEPFRSAWAFDVELLHRLLHGSATAEAIAEDALVEVPLTTWRDVGGSKLRFGPRPLRAGRPGRDRALGPTSATAVSRWSHRLAWADRAWRRATAPARDLPDFVILGAQRSGTTSLYDWLSDHPAVVPATRKEVHYFDLHYDRGLGWYRAHFPMGHGAHLTGEATPYLLFHPLAPDRVARDLPPTTRFVVLLRHPVQRAVSHYWHERRMGTESETLAVAVAAEEQRLAGADGQVPAR